jgi:hypothetical protein
MTVCIVEVKEFETDKDTIIILENLHYNKNLEEYFFTTRYLEKGL